MNRKVTFDVLVPAGVLSFTVFVVSILTIPVVSADDSVVDQVALTVPVSCTMSGTGMNSHTATLQNNDYTPNIGTTTLHAFCNDTNGFAIYAAGYTGDEIGGTNSTKLVGTPSTIGNIDTGTATSGNTSNWAMKLAITQDSGDTTGTNAVAIDNSFNNYHVVPNEYTKVAHKNTSTNMDNTTGGVKLTTTYAAFINSTQPAGTYTGKVIYTLVHPSTEIPAQSQTTASGQICYYSNTTTSEGTMGCQTIPESETVDGVSPTSATLLASNFSRTGYGFAGWSDVYDYETNSNAHFYGPNEDISFTEGQYSSPNQGLSLYAIWIPSAGSLQDASKVSQLCGTGTGSLTAAVYNNEGDSDESTWSITANLSSVSALTDLRDNQTYAIAKLADGKCWMIENLRLESTAAHNSDGTLAQGYGTSATYGNFTGLADAENENFTNTNPPIANSLYSTDGSTINTIQGGNSSSYLYRMPRYNNQNTHSRASNPAPTTNDAAMYSYGNYYTWAAAIASVIEYTSATAQVDGKTSETANTSLCPTGWRLPYGGTSGNGVTAGGLSYLDSQLGGTGTTSSPNSTPTGAIMSARWRSFPNNFLYSGRFSTSSASARSTWGLYWTSTAWGNGSSSNFASSMVLNNIAKGVNPGSGMNKYYGFSIRCTVSVGT